MAGERAELFDRLMGFLSADQSDDAIAATAAANGLSEGAVKVSIHRLRRRYGVLLRAEIAETVADPGAVEDEARHLIAAFGK